MPTAHFRYFKIVTLFLVWLIKRGMFCFSFAGMIMVILLLLVAIVVVAVWPTN